MAMQLELIEIPKVMKRMFKLISLRDHEVKRTEDHEALAYIVCEQEC